MARCSGRKGDAHRQVTAKVLGQRPHPPLRPAKNACHVLATSPPSGVGAPSPVTTTVGWSVPTAISSSGLGLDDDKFGPVARSAAELTLSR